MFERFQRWMTDKGEHTPTPRPLVQKILSFTAIGLMFFICGVGLFIVGITTLIEILAWLA